MRIRRTEVRVHVCLNYFVLTCLCLYLLVMAWINFANQINVAERIRQLKPFPSIGCNGHVQLCDRKYSNITQIAAHDSPFVGILPNDDQNLDVIAQLNAGIRFLTAQTHRSPLGTLSLCHTSCLIENAGSLQDYLSTIKGWLDTHPNQVVTLLLTNGDNLNIGAFDEAFTASTIVKYAYSPFPTHNSSLLDSWPTLAELISTNKRLVAFLDYGADPASAPYILDEFTYFWEIPFDTTNPAFPQCDVDRPKGMTEDERGQRMYIVNHYLDSNVLGMDLPDRRDAGRVNSRGSIGAQAGLCAGLYGRGPVGVLVDYFDEGGGVGVGDFLNGV